MLTVEKFSKTVFGVHILLPLRREGWEGLPAGRRESFYSEFSSPGPQPGTRQCLSSALSAAPGQSPPGQCPGLCLWWPLMPTAEPTALAFYVGAAAHRRRNALVPQALWSAAAHTVKQCSLYLRSFIRIIGLNPCLSQCACSKITPKPRNSWKKRILNTFLLFVLTKIQTSVNTFKR